MIYFLLGGVKNNGGLQMGLFNQSSKKEKASESDGNSGGVFMMHRLKAVRLWMALRMEIWIAMYNGNVNMKIH